MMSFNRFRAGVPDRKFGGAAPPPLGGIRCLPGCINRVPSGVAGRPAGPQRFGRRSADQQRQGVIAVEAALTLPLMFLLLFGSIEITNGIFVSQALATAGYEGAREASRPGSTAAMVNQRIDEILRSRGIRDYQVSLDPSPALNTPRGVPITVTVTAPMNALSFHLADVTGGRTLESSITMVRH